MRRSVVPPHVVVVCDTDAERRRQCLNALAFFEGYTCYEAADLDELFDLVDGDDTAPDVAILPASIADAAVVAQLKTQGCVTIRTSGIFRRDHILPNTDNNGAAAYVLHSELHLLGHVVALVHDCEVLHRSYAREVWHRSASPSTSVFNALTKRERQVLRFAREGMSYEAIAQRLSISVKTVGTHITNAYTKLAPVAGRHPVQRSNFINEHIDEL